MDSNPRVTTSSIPRAFVERSFMGLTAAGVDMSAVFDRLGVDPKNLDDPLPLSFLYEMWESVVRVTGRHDLGLRLGMMIRPEMWEVFGYVISRSDTLGDALVRAGRYIRLVTDTVEISFKVEGDRALVTYRPSAAALVHPQSSELIVTAIGQIGRQITGKHLVPLEVRFTHPAPPDTSPQEEVFEAPVHYGRPDNGYVFSSELLHLPVITRDSALLAVLEQHAQQILESLPKAGELSTRVREVIAGELRGGNPGTDNVASQLGMHPKTLSRRLKAEGTSHQQLLDDLRRELAERHLRESRLSVGEVAYMLGFSDASAFTKAFRRWTGTTPQAFRTNAGFT